MIMKRLVIFDLDGTLLDTSEGIIHSYTETGRALSLVPKNVENKKCVIGGPLNVGFDTLYEVGSGELMDRAVEHYREVYSAEGINMFSPYDGVRELLAALRENGISTAVATLKYEPFAKRMLGNAGIAGYFDIICGFDRTEKCTKSYILNHVMEAMGFDRSDCVLVGDSQYDSNGASLAGIDFIGVTYGFGITKVKAFEFDNIFIADSPEQVKNFLLSR